MVRNRAAGDTTRNSVTVGRPGRAHVLCAQVVPRCQSPGMAWPSVIEVDMADEESLLWERRLLAVTEINARLLGGVPADDVLRLIAEQARQLSTSDQVLILLTDRG